MDRSWLTFRIMGRPLLVTDAGSDWYAQIGVSSWGIGCATPGRHGVYADVAAARDWVALAVAGGYSPPEATEISCAGACDGAGFTQADGVMCYCDASQRAPACEGAECPEH